MSRLSLKELKSTFIPYRKGQGLWAGNNSKSILADESLFRMLSSRMAHIESCSLAKAPLWWPEKILIKFNLWNFLYAKRMHRWAVKVERWALDYLFGDGKVCIVLYEMKIWREFKIFWWINFNFSNFWFLKYGNFFG
jgi:hypothetical protein